MRKVLIGTLVMLGTLAPTFIFAQGGPPQNVVQTRDSFGQHAQNEERLVEEVLRLLNEAGGRAEDEDRVLAEVGRLLGLDAVEINEMLQAEAEDQTDGDEPPNPQNKKDSKGNKASGKKEPKKDKDKHKKNGEGLSETGSSAGVARGDFNGDGVADLAVGAPFEDILVSFFESGTFQVRLETRSDAGAVNVIYGSASGLTAGSATAPTNQFWTQATGPIQAFPFPALLDVPERNDNFGAAVAAGDFNGDGFSDLAVAVPGEVTTIPGTTTSVRGAVQVLYGSANGLTGIDDQLIALPDLFADAAAESAFLRLGNALVWGDFNGDGFGDLAVEGANRLDPARLSVLFGSAAGLNRGAARVEFEFSNAVGGIIAESQLTDMALATGEFNADIFDDLVVGLPRADVGLARDAGAVHILFGSSTGPTLTDAQVFHQDAVAGTATVPDQSEGFDQFGFALAVGDFNGDTLADLAVGVPFEDVRAGVLQTTIADVGVVHVFFNSATGLSIAGSQFFQQNSSSGTGDRNAEANDTFGFALAAGDFNDDELGDLAIGAPGETIAGSAGAGSVSVKYGSSGLVSGPAEQFWTEATTGLGGTPAEGDRFGSSLTAWNFGRNQVFFGLPTRTVATTDLAIGIPGKQVSGRSDAGAVRVIYGSSTGLSTVLFGSPTAPGPTQLWTQDTPGVADQAEADDRFGSALY